MRDIILRVALLFTVLVCCSQECGAAIGDVFLQVTDEALLRDGDEVVVVNVDNRAGLSVCQGDRYVKACRISVGESDNTVSASTDSLCLLTLKKVKGGWTLTRNDGKCLGALNSSSESLYFGADDGRGISVANFSFEESGDCIVEFRKHYLKFTKTGGGRFGSYTGPKSVLPIQLYRKLKNPAVYDVLTLHESGGNAQALSEIMDARVKTVVIGRRFVGDGGFYTICLPVELNESDLQTAFPGATFYRFSSMAADGDDAVVFHFRVVSRTAAGEPYIMRLADGTEISAPRVGNKVVMAEEPHSVSNQLGGWRYTFTGAFDPVLLPANGSTRFLDRSGGQLVTPNREGSLPGLRGYFSIPEPSTSTGMDVTAGGQRYVVSLDGVDDGDGTTPAGALPAHDAASRQHIIYNVNGTRMREKIQRLPKGLYVVDGKKCMIK